MLKFEVFLLEVADDLQLFQPLVLKLFQLLTEGLVDLAASLLATCRGK